jgi:cytosine/adenosine deaminase-related metal-dependent hydrolase
VTVSSPAPLLIRHAHVYPAAPDGGVIADGTVLALDGRIAYVGAETGGEDAVAQLSREHGGRIRTIDGRGAMVLPGFVNAHWHELFAMRLAFNGALRSPSDRADRPGFMSCGGDMHLIGTVFDSFHDLIAGLTADEALAIARYSMWTQLRAGVTTLGDVGSVNHPEALIAAATQLGMRCSVSTWACDALGVPDSTKYRRSRDTDAVLARAESMLRRCARDRTGLIRGRPTAVYPIAMTDELGRGLAELADRFDTPFATHVGAQRNEPAHTERYFGLSPIRRLSALGLLNHRLMAVHCAFADETERAMLVEHHVHINHSPAKYGGHGESALTETRMIPELRRAGLAVSLSTDGAPLSFAGMPEAMRAAWQMHNELYADPTVVLPTDALAMATRIAAQGLEWDAEIGSIEVGKQADLVLVRTEDWRYLLNPRPLEAFLTLGGSADVDTVIVGGRVLIEDGRAAVADEAALRADYLSALRSFAVRCQGVDPGTADAVIARASRPTVTLRS